MNSINNRQSMLILNISTARLAQSAERKALNLVVVGSSPTVGVSACTQKCALCSCTSLMCMQLPLKHHRDQWCYIFPFKETLVFLC